MTCSLRAIPGDQMTGALLRSPPASASWRGRESPYTYGVVVTQFVTHVAGPGPPTGCFKGHRDLPRDAAGGQGDLPGASLGLCLPGLSWSNTRQGGHHAAVADLSSAAIWGERLCRCASLPGSRTATGLPILTEAERGGPAPSGTRFRPYAVG